MVGLGLMLMLTYVDLRADRICASTLSEVIEP